MKQTALFSALLCASSLAWGADLVSIYHQAQAYDAAFAAASAAREAGQEKTIQARAGLLPQVGASASTSWNTLNYDRPAGITKDPSYNTNGYQIQLTQPLFHWEKWIAYQQSELQTALAQTNYRAAEQDLILRVASAYFGVLSAQVSFNASTSLKTASAQQLALAQKSFEIGTVTITDVHEAQSRFDLASAQVISTENALNVSRQNLVQLIGNIPEQLPEFRAKLPLKAPEPADVNSWARAAQTDNFAVQARQIENRLAQEAVSRSQAGHLPTLDMVASYGKNHSGFGSNGTETDYTNRQIGLQLNVPIFTGGAISSATREAIALKAQAEANLLNAQRSAALAAHQAYLNTTSGIAQVNALEAALRSSTSSLESNKLGYEVGVRINIDVLNAQSQVAETTRQLAKAWNDTLLAQLQLKATNGSLNEEDLIQIDRLFTEPASTPDNVTPPTETQTIQHPPQTPAVKKKHASK